LGDCLLWAVLRKYRIGWPAFFHVKRRVLILTKMASATFWSSFSQPHQVTLNDNDDDDA
jgi:hypothetical protein